MKNSIINFAKLLTITLTLLFTINTNAIQAQEVNLEEVFATAQGHTLKLKHAMAFISELQKNGIIPANPNQEQLQAAASELMLAFYQNPAEILQSLQNLDTNTTAVSKSVNNVNPSPTYASNGFSLESTYRSATKQMGVDASVVKFNTPRSIQAKQIISGASAVKRNSNSSDSYSNDFYAYSSSTSTLHFCTNGTFYSTISSHVSAGGGGTSGLSSGEEIDMSGQWDLVESNGIIFILLHVPNDPDLIKVKGIVFMGITALGSDYITLDFRDGNPLSYRLNPGAAVSR